MQNLKMTREMLFAWLLSLPALTPNERLLALAYATHWMPGKREMFPSIPRLAELTGLSKSTVSRTKRSLKDKKVFSFRDRKLKGARKAHNSTMAKAYENRIVQWAETTGWIDPTPRDEPREPLIPQKVLSDAELKELRKKEDAKLRCPGGFDRVVKAYPQATHIRESWEYWKKLDPSPEVVEEILAGIDRWRVSGKWATGRIFSLFNFLKDRRYKELQNIDPYRNPDHF